MSLGAGACSTTPPRDLLLFCAFLVVVFTLIGQGLTFGPVADHEERTLPPHESH